MQRSNTDVWVGMLVLLGAAALLFLAMQSANLLSISWQKTYSVYAYFDNIGGLKKQAAIKSASLKILTSGLLGEQYIGIEAGSDVANLVQGDKLQSTQSAVVLENLISRFLYNKAADGPAPSGSQ